MGEVFGKYELLERIGAGGMAEVFRAKTFGPEGFVKDVVIKRILPAFSEDPDFVQMFINEARLAARLPHANIVQIFEFDHVEGVYYIAMEWVDGTDLKRIIDRSRSRDMPVPISMAVHVGVETCKGLNFASQRAENGVSLNLVHRDISPHNLLVSFAGEVKIADFGIAKVAAMASATRDGMLKGKLPYMSPEQAGNLPLDGRSDIYSLGVVLWELLTGRRLFQGDSEAELFARVRRAEVPSPRSLNAAINRGLEQVVLKMLARCADERYQTAKEALGELIHFARVEDALDVAAYLRSLMPDVVARDQRGDTSRLDPELALSKAVTPAASDAPTRTVGMAGPETSARPATCNHRHRSSSLRLRAVVALLLCLGAFSILGWWLTRQAAGPQDEMGPVASLRVESRPSGAAIRIDLIPLGDTPLEVEGRTGQSFNLEGRMGRSTRKLQAILPEGQERQILSFRRDASSTPDLGGKQPDAGMESGPAVIRRARPKWGVSSPRATRFRNMSSKRNHAATERARWGMIDVVVSPWAQVRVDGRDVGHTPLLRYHLPAGRHRVELFNSELDKRTSQIVEVVAGQKRTIRKQWDQ